MSKRKRKPKSPSLSALLTLLELRQAVTQHCTALRSVVLLMQDNKPTAAMARLEGAVAALEQTIRGQCCEFSMPCPMCGRPQGLEAWVDRQQCSACGQFLDATASE